MHDTKRNLYTAENVDAILNSIWVDGSDNDRSFVDGIDQEVLEEIHVDRQTVQEWFLSKHEFAEQVQETIALRQRSDHLEYAD